MKTLPTLLFACAAALAVAQDDPPHLHGPDGRHIVAPTASAGADVYVLSHHDLRIEGADGRAIAGATVESTIAREPGGEVVHTERNAYEPENEVYGSHMTYTEPGEYRIDQAVTLPDGRRLDVRFPVYVPAPAEAAHAHGPNIPLIVAGILGSVFLLAAAYRLGRRSARIGGGAAMLALALGSAVVLSGPARAQDDGHQHGPDGRHVVSPQAVDDAGPALRAYAAPDRGATAERVVDGVRFVLSIENEEIVPDPALVAIGEEQAKLIGLTVEEVEFSPTGGGLQTTGRISANPNGLVIIDARSSGRVAALGALPGTAVRRGQVLAVIESPDLADAQAAHQAAVTGVAQAGAAVRIARSSVETAKTRADAAARVLARQKQLAEAGAFASPALEAARSQRSSAESRASSARSAARALEATVARLERGVASGVVARRELESARAELEAAHASLDDAEKQRTLAQEALAREESLARQGLRDAAEVEAAQAEADVARAHFASARNALVQSEADLRRAQAAVRTARDRVLLLGGTPGGGHRITIAAPISGEVEHRMVSVGQTVAAGQQLYDLLNADVVWVLCDLYEKDIARVRVGQRAEIVADALPGRTYAGEVAFIHNEVDPEARTTSVRVVVDNPGERLKQNMFVRVQLGTGAPGQTLVPTAAVQTTGGVSTVFVEQAPGTYRQTVVQVAGTLGNRTLVKAGLQPGARVVTDGAYQLLAMAVSR